MPSYVLPFPLSEWRWTSDFGAIERDRYVCYHRTGYADQCEGKAWRTAAANVSKRNPRHEFSEILNQLRCDDEVLEWVRDALHGSRAGEHDEAACSISLPNCSCGMAKWLPLLKHSYRPQD